MSGDGPRATSLSLLEDADGLVVSVPRVRPRPPASLTAAEHEVYALLLEGLSDAEIAACRGVSRATVAKQARAIYQKAGVSDRLELVLRRSSSGARLLAEPGESEPPTAAPHQ